MQCPVCRADLLEGARFCPNCGAPLPVICPDCGSPLPAGGRFCPACGARVVEASAEAEAPGPPTGGDAVTGGGEATSSPPAPAAGLPPLPLAFLGGMLLPGADLIVGGPPVEQEQPPEGEAPA